MKTKKKILLSLLLVTLGVGLAYGTQVLIGSLQTVNNTTVNSAGVILPETANVLPHTLTIQTAGLTATTALSVAGQVSLDSNNWVTVATYLPSSTNAGTVIWTTGQTNMPIYARVAVTTTNSVQIGITLVQ